LLRVERVHFDQSVENLDEVCHVDRADAFGNAVVNLEELVDFLDVVAREEKRGVGVGSCNDPLEVLLDVLED
jgi:hypothetical protein